MYLFIHLALSFNVYMKDCAAWAGLGRGGTERNETECLYIHTHTCNLCFRGRRGLEYLFYIFALPPAVAVIVDNLAILMQNVVWLMYSSSCSSPFLGRGTYTYAMIIVQQPFFFFNYSWFKLIYTCKAALLEAVSLSTSLHFGLEGGVPKLYTSRYTVRA